MFVNSVSRSNKKTRRKFDSNIHKKRFWVAEENRWVTLKVSARGIRTIAKKGISKILSELRSTGVKV
jgi:large subunit ribosomal protein L28